MHLQGNLQAVFDALYNLGIIDPVLEMDWSGAMREMEESKELVTAIQIANCYHASPLRLQEELEKLDERTLNFLAMEVAREYADYHSRESLQ